MGIYYYCSKQHYDPGTMYRVLLYHLHAHDTCSYIPATIGNTFHNIPQHCIQPGSYCARGESIDHALNNAVIKIPFTLRSACMQCLFSRMNIIIMFSYWEAQDTKINYKHIHTYYMIHNVCTHAQTWFKATMSDQPSHSTMSSKPLGTGSLCYTLLLLAPWDCCTTQGIWGVL